VEWGAFSSGVLVISSFGSADLVEWGAFTSGVLVRRVLFRRDVSAGFLVAAEIGAGVRITLTTFATGVGRTDSNAVSERTVLGAGVFKLSNTFLTGVHTSSDSVLIVVSVPGNKTSDAGTDDAAVSLLAAMGVLTTVPRLEGAREDLLPRLPDRTAVKGVFCLRTDLGAGVARDSNTFLTGVLHSS